MKNEVIIGDCADVLKQFEDESIDCIVTDPPYGYSFMGLSWDKALPSLEALKECNRVLKSGAFGFFMCAPRQDVLSRMIVRLEDAGFNTGFSSIMWAYASGFPKSTNLSKAIDRKFGAEREVIGIREDFKSKKAAEFKRGIDSKRYWNDLHDPGRGGFCNPSKSWEITAPATDKAREFSGAYTASLKPALEVIITVMKPLKCKSYTDQVLDNGKGCLWLDDCKIPYELEADIWKDHEATGLSKVKFFGNNDTVIKKSAYTPGRFPANLLVSDNVLDQGINKKGIGKSYSGYENKLDNAAFNFGNEGKERRRVISDSGDFSRYFSLDAWWSKKISELPEEQQKTFPFLITPKPSKSEKNKYIENKHPTVKPLKLMSYLITMGSREGDLILDPFAGSGTTLEACKLLNRRFVGIDIDPDNEKYMRARGQLESPTLEAFVK